MAKVLDCTLRDGGYYNLWDFDPDLVNKYFRAISKTGIDAIEIGFRFTPKNTFYGPWAYSRDDYIDREFGASLKPLGVMVNGSDVASCPATDLFRPYSKSAITRVRIALHYGKIEECAMFAHEIKDMGYYLGVNMMQTGGKSYREIVKAVGIIACWKPDVIYFADSLGNMCPDDVEKTVRIIKDVWAGDVGFHGHDNQGRAVVNSHAAIDGGAEWVDGTIRGIGRGAGNARTEFLLLDLQKNPEPIFQIVLDEFYELQQKYKWGVDLHYYLAAANDIHPTYIQKMSSSLKYDKSKILGGIHNLLSCVDANSYNEAQLSASRVSYSGSWSAKDWVKDREVLVVAAGAEAKKHRKYLEYFAHKNNLFVVCLNCSTGFDNDMVGAYAVCDITRLVTEGDVYKDFNKPVLSAQYLGGLDYGLAIKKDTWQANEKNCVIPDLLVAPYAFAALIAGGAKKVFLAGFDGYTETSEQEMQRDMQRVFDLYKSNCDVPMIAITKTNYSIQQSSVYCL